MKKLIAQIIAAALGLWLAVLFIPEVKVNLYPDSNIFGISITSEWQIFLVLGVILGLLNFFIRPVLMAITLPLRMLTLGILGLVINMAMIWVVDMGFKELTAPWFWPIAKATVIIWLLSFIVLKLMSDKKEGWG